MSVSTAEFTPTTGEQVTFEIDNIQETLGLGLFLLGENKSAIRLAKIIEYSVDPIAVDVADVVERTEEKIFETVDEVAVTQKREFCTAIHSAYPEQFDAESAIVTPRQFSKKHDIDSQRGHLREAYNEQVSASKVALLAAVKNDNPREGVQIDIDREEIEDCVTHLAVDLREQIKDAVAEIVPLLPRQIEDASTVAKLAHLIFGRERDFIIIENTDVEPEELNDKLNTLSELLIRARGWQTTLTDAAHDIFQEYTKTEATHQLAQRYNGFAQATVTDLGKNIAIAYEDIRMYRPVHKPNFEESLTPLTVVKKRSSDTNEAETHEHANALEIEETNLGTIESPFPWLEGANVDISLLRQNGRDILFSRALWPDAQALSDRLRATTDVGRKFPAFEKRIKKIELSGTAIGHSGIRRVYDADFHDVTVCYMRDTRTNAGRTYYARTNAGHFPEVAVMAEKAGVDPNTPFIILIAETDKTHQMRVFQGLGFKRAGARKGGVGPT